MISVGDLISVLRLRDEMSPALITAQKNLDKAQKGFEDAGAKAKSAGTAMSTYVTAPILAAASASAFLSSQWETTTTRLSSLAGVQAADLDMVRQKMLALAPEVGIGPNALAIAMTKITSTISDTNVALDILDRAARGSAAGMGEAVDVAGALTAVINSYGANNITAARAADILTRAVKDGGAEAKELAPTLANVVPLAAQLGITFEEVAANIATVTKLGVPANEAVTQLSSVMSAAIKPTKEGREALGQLGMTYDSLRQSIKEKGLAATLIDLTTRFGDNKEALTQVFGRIEALRNVMSSAGQQAEIYTAEVKAMKDSVGDMDKAFEAMTSTQEFGWKQLGASIQAIGITIGDSLAPTIRDFISSAKPVLNWLMDVAKWFGTLDSTTKTFIIAFGGFVAAVGPVLFVGGQLAMGMAAIIELAPALGAAWVIATGPVGAAALAVAGLAAAVLIFKNNMAQLEGKSSAGQPIAALAENGAKAKITLDQVNAEMAKLGNQAVTTFNGVNMLTGAVGKAAEAAGTHRLQTEEERKEAEALAKKLADVAKEIREAERDTGRLTNAQKLAVLHLDKLGISAENAGLHLGVSGKAVQAYVDEMNDLIKTMHQQDEATGQFQQSFDKMVFGYNAAGHVIQGFHGVLREDITLLDTVAAAGRTVGGDMVREVVPAFSMMTEGLAGSKGLTQGAREAAAAVETMGSRIKTTVLGIPDLMIQAFTGGGGIAGAMKALATQLGADFGKSLIEGIKKSIDAGGSGITDVTKKAAAASGVITGLSVAMGGASGKASAASAAMAGVGVAASAIGSGATIASAAALGAATAGIGLAAVGAYFAIKKLTSDPEKKVNPVREEFVRLHGGLNELNKQAQAAGVTLTAMLNARNPEQYKRAIDELNAAFKFQDDAMKTLDDTIAKYGFTLEELPKKLGQERLTAQFMQLYKDEQVLLAGGFSLDAIIQKQAKSYQDLVTSAMKSGLAIPEQMRPILQKMAEMGLLTDDAGNKMENLEKLTFAETLDQQVQTLVSSIKDLVDAINRGLGNAIRNIPPMPPIAPPNMPDFAPEPTPMASGGDFMVSRPTLFLAGEAGPERATFTPVSGSSSAGGGKGATVIVEIDKRWFAEILVPEMPGAIARLGLA